MLNPLPEALLDLKKWDQLSREECVEVASQVERLLPPTFRFSGLETYRSASDQHNVAYFEWLAPTGLLLTYLDLHIDPEYGWRGLASDPEVEAHEDWLDLPQHVRNNLW